MNTPIVLTEAQQKRLSDLCQSLWQNEMESWEDGYEAVKDFIENEILNPQSSSTDQNNEASNIED